MYNRNRITKPVGCSDKYIRAVRKSINRDMKFYNSLDKIVEKDSRIGSSDGIFSFVIKTIFAK